MVKSSANDLKPPIQLTAKEDHQRLMKLLKIDSLRSGPSGNPQAPNAANVDELKASPYKNLPDPLITKNGEKVTSAKRWWNKRRDEIVEEFDREVYGRISKKTPLVKWELLSTRKDTVGKIPVIEKKLIDHVDNSSYPFITIDIP